MNYINSFCDYLKVVKKYSENTIISYKKDILQFYLFVQNRNLNLLTVDYDVIKDYLTELYNQKITRSSISRKLSSLRSFYDYLVKKEIIVHNDFKEIANPKVEKKLPSVLTSDQIEEMSKVPDMTTPLGQRNLLIVEMLFATGLRVGELVNVKLADINFIDRMIKVLGKGNKERIVIYNQHTRIILNKYLKEGRNQLMKKSTDYLFLNYRGEKLSERMVWNVINDIIAKTDIKVHVSPHKLRHSFATEMLSHGADLVSVQELLGHESLNTTSIYTHLSDEQIRKVYENTHPRAKK